MSVTRKAEEGRHEVLVTVGEVTVTLTPAQAELLRDDLDEASLEPEWCEKCHERAVPEDGGPWYGMCPPCHGDDEARDYEEADW